MTKKISGPTYRNRSKWDKSINTCDFAFVVPQIKAHGLEDVLLELAVAWPIYILLQCELF